MGQQESEVGGGKRRGRAGDTDFSFKAKGELCQLTVSTCAGSLTWQWEQTAGDSRATSAAFLSMTLKGPQVPGSSSSFHQETLPSYTSPGWFYKGPSNHRASDPDVLGFLVDSSRAQT